MNKSKERGGWVPIDKRFKNLLPKDREYSYLEAMVSYSVDRDNKKRGSINGYAALWKWSRDKVRRFVHTIESGADYQTDAHKTGKRQRIRYIFNKLEDAENRLSHPPSHPQADTTIDPNPLILKPKEYKETDKGAPTEPSLYPLSFSAYVKLRGLDEDDEEVLTVSYYLETYKKKRGHEHPRLKGYQWDQVIFDIFGAVDPDYNTDISVGSCDRMMDVIDKHFQTDYRDGCDYNILHFTSGHIIYYRIRECENVWVD